MLVELRQLGSRQAVDALLDLRRVNAQCNELVLDPLILEHAQQLLAIDLLLLSGNHLSRAKHCCMGERHLRHQQDMGHRQYRCQPTHE
ncbi:hypothetical protein D3C77_578310 [compost metagenome]